MRESMMSLDINLKVLVKTTESQNSVSDMP